MAAIQGLPASLTAPAPAPAAATGSSGASQQDFLKLLVAELANQDPLDPQKGADFVAQLATFSSLEQSTQMNKQLGTIATAQNSSQRAALAGFIGKTISARTDTIAIGAAGAPTLSLHLGGASGKTQMTVTDAGGNVVRTLDLGTRATGDSPIVWDGTDISGKRLAPGNYTISISATAPDGSKIAGEADVRGVVDSLEFPIDGNPRFRIGGATVAPADIISVNG